MNTIKTWTPDIEKQARQGYGLTCKNCGKTYNEHYPHPELPCPKIKKRRKVFRRNVWDGKSIAGGTFEREE